MMFMDKSQELKKNQETIKIFIRHEEDGKVCSMDVYPESTLKQIYESVSSLFGIHYGTCPLFINEMNMQKTFDKSCSVRQVGLKNGYLLTINSREYDEVKNLGILEIAV